MIVKSLGWDNKVMNAYEFPSAKGAIEYVSDLHDKGFIGEEGIVKTIILFEIGIGDEVIQ